MRRVLLFCWAAVAVAACSDDISAPETLRPRLSLAGGTSSYVIDFTGTSLPSTLEADVAAAGGTVTARVNQIGVAVASSDDPSFAARASKIRGVRTVTPDELVQWIQPQVADEAFEVTADDDVGAQAHEIGGHETFRLIQWAPDAISAPEAWALGYRGQGVRVAVLDGGLHSAHIDIGPNLDAARSRSFVAGQPYNADVGTFWHGTHVAGIVAAPANNRGTVGIAPEATLIGVKVLHNGTGSFQGVVQGIVYAATPIDEGGAGADIINLSLGAGFPKRSEGAAALKNSVAKALSYAYQRGVVVVAALGNDAINLDHTADLIFIPAMSPQTISVSALSPVGWALGASNLDVPTTYTNFGQSAVDLAGPGGDFAYPGNQVCAVPRLDGGNVVNPCWVFDGVMAPVRGAGAATGSYNWARGTSMAAPAVSGVAAIILSKTPTLSPSQVLTILRASADDLGKPGNDDFYGLGRVNALRAVQLK